MCDFDRRDDDVAEIPGVERLATKFAGPRDGKNRRAVHKPPQPPQMLAIEPAKHQGRTQHDMGDFHRIDEALLRRLGLHVKILRLGIHDGRGDMDEIGDVVSADGVDDALGRRHVVGDEFGAVEAADLGLVDDDRVGPREGLHPGAGDAQVRLDHFYLGVKLPQARGVGRVLVDAHDAIAARGETRDKILADKAGSASDDDCLHRTLHGEVIED